ncbi:hypothetical protein NQ024_10345 [Corynebacterium sp. 35RC1]|nr:hypothetical protein [Corynebacterium sp. 35RC1]
MQKLGTMDAEMVFKLHYQLCYDPSPQAHHLYERVWESLKLVFAS